VTITPNIATIADKVPDPRPPDLSGPNTPHPAEAWAICCSGGGIRSASYCLGALQRLGEANFLAKTKAIIGVSGGSYIAASRALVADRLARAARAAGVSGDGATGADAGHGAAGAAAPAYAPGTPEEQHLRDNTRYLVPDAKTLLAGVLSLLFGVAVTLVLFLTPLFAASHIWGWLLRSQGVLSGHPPAAVVGSVTWWIWPVIAAGVTLAVFGWWWATLAPSDRGGDRHCQVAVKTLGWAAFLSSVIAVAMLAVPESIAWLSGSHAGALKTVLDDLGFGAGTAWTPAALVGFVGAVIAIAQSAQKALSKFQATSPAPAAQAPAGQPSATQQPAGFGATVMQYVRSLLLPWVASVLILLVGFVAALRWTRDGAAAGFSSDQVWVVVGALGVMLVTRVLTDANRISLHDFYRWRLATAYAVVRKDTGFGTEDSQGTRLSELTRDPRLVICATANINAKREVPVGRDGLSISFDSTHVTLRGPDPRDPVQASTADYEVLVGRKRCTLFDASAISGAAFSPLMGVATQQAHRILFTATDLRLGVWLPHPAIVKAASEELKTQQKPDRWWYALWLLAWYIRPHARWRSGDEQPGGREARLWAYILRLRKDGRFFGGLLYQALQPTLGMLYAEAAGHTSYRCTWICVTDGGHYDNLGLVEALQRTTELGYTHILVLDASGDRADTWFTLGGSIAQARSDAATEISLNPTQMTGPLKPGMPALKNGEVLQPWATGTFTACGPPGAPKSTIVVCKLGWWTGAPWDVRAYAAGHPTYPTDSTLDQLYDSAEFDAYRELGWAAVDMAIAAAQIPVGT